MNEEVLAAAADALARGDAAALVTVVRANGSTPQRAGAKMLVFADGRTVGTIGGGCYENDAFWKAREAITTGKGVLLHYDLNDDFAQENGLVCGGQMDVHVDPLAPAPRLYIIGAGHVGWHVARLAHTAGFRTHIVDDREKFANRERFPDADDVIVEPIAEWLDRATLPATAYAVIVTRGHQADLEAMRSLAARDLAYLGPDWKPREDRAHQPGAPVRGAPGRMPRAGPRADRARYRRRHAGGNRDQHRCGARGRPAWRRRQPAGHVVQASSSARPDALSL